MVPVACTAEGVGSGRVARITCPGPKAPALVLNELSAFPGSTALRWKTYRPALPLVGESPASGSPYPVAGRSLRPSMGSVHSDSLALRHPGFVDQFAFGESVPE